jgi:hypothetical protein
MNIKKDSGVAKVVSKKKFVRDGAASPESAISGREFGAVEWIRTTTVLLPPAPQAGASANSATTAF